MNYPLPMFQQSITHPSAYVTCLPVTDSMLCMCSSSGTCTQRWVPSSCRTRQRSWRARSTCATGAYCLLLPSSRAAHGQLCLLCVHGMAACDSICAGPLQAAKHGSMARSALTFRQCHLTHLRATFLRNPCAAATRRTTCSTPSRRASTPSGTCRSRPWTLRTS
jgi:hypothetical protein